MLHPWQCQHTVQHVVHHYEDHDSYGCLLSSEAFGSHEMCALVCEHHHQQLIECCGMHSVCRADAYVSVSGMTAGRTFFTFSKKDMHISLQLAQVSISLL